jgi:hypothetical protein
VNPVLPPDPIAEDCRSDQEKSVVDASPAISSCTLTAIPASCCRVGVAHLAADLRDMQHGRVEELPSQRHLPFG